MLMNRENNYGTDQDSKMYCNSYYELVLPFNSANVIKYDVS